MIEPESALDLHLDQVPFALVLVALLLAQLVFGAGVLQPAVVGEETGERGYDSGRAEAPA
ncbi:hypothetical protein [Saccharopolyspora hattusasensis]|uniref:hypothetical protein n=1 Tax=Saccharopolyspora hattusasensis TaxID=1128679 RepID=UPI003D97CEF1